MIGTVWYKYNSHSFSLLVLCMRLQAIIILNRAKNLFFMMDRFNKKIVHFGNTGIWCQRANRL